MVEESPEALREQLQRREGELARQTLDAAVATVDATAGSVLLHEPKTNKLVFKYVIGVSADRLTGFEMDAGQRSIAGQVFAARTGQISPDTLTDPNFFPGIDKQTGEETRNLVTVPLTTTEGRAIGAMQVMNKRHGAFDEQDLHVLEVLSAQAASAIETAQLHEDAKLAEVAHLIGDISHDVKNMVTPVVTGAQTLEFMVQQMWDELDAALSEPAAPPEWSDRVRRAVQGVRKFFPEAMEMT